METDETETLVKHLKNWPAETWPASARRFKKVIAEGGFFYEVGVTQILTFGECLSTSFGSIYGFLLIHFGIILGFILGLILSSFWDSFWDPCREPFFQ